VSGGRNFFRFVALTASLALCTPFANAEIKLADATCLTSDGFFRLVAPESPKRKLMLSVRALHIGRPADIRMEKSSGVREVDYRAMRLLTSCTFVGTFSDGSLPPLVALDFDMPA
jgi:hypothetical protein